MGDNLHTLAHAQFGRWACENRTVYADNYSGVSAGAIGFGYWNKLKGYMHTSAHAPIGSRRAAHLSAHAKSRSCRNIGVRRCDKYQTNERADNVQRTIGWAQSSCATPNCSQTPRRNSRGGVVDLSDCFWPMAGIELSHALSCSLGFLESRLGYLGLPWALPVLFWARQEV